MTPAVRRAIARVVARREDGGRTTGTAFLVAEGYVLTAFHVVGDRAATRHLGHPVLHPSLRLAFDDAGITELVGRVVEGCWDAEADWALIALQAPIAGIRPIPLGAVADREVDDLKQHGASLAFESWGFPTLATRSGASGIMIDGRVLGCNAQYDNARAYQLYSDGAAAAFGDPFNGLSGAPCLIEGAAVGILRANLLAPENAAQPHQPRHIMGGTLYACPIDTATLQERCQPYLPPLDPMRGLPGIPPGTLPAEPFRYLHWYGAEHAEVFFGRRRKIRELYKKVTHDEAPPVVLVYGASGVGKSSLLEAGLLPRLSGQYQTHAWRYEVSQNLAQTFAARFDAARAEWQSTHKPAVLLIDQIEAIFMHTTSDGNAELSALGSQITRVLTHAAPMPVRILLGFRSEWLAQVRSRLDEAAVPYSECHLERLAHQEIAEIAQGVASTPRLRQWYQMEVDEALPRRMADDLLADPQSPVSPVLSIMLTRLWKEAKRQRAGAQRLRTTVYDAQMRGKLTLRTFLDEQIQEVAKTREEDEASGLINDVLYRHTTEAQTATAVSWAELRRRYPHLEQGPCSAGDYLRGLVEALGAQSLLYSVDAKNDLQPRAQADDDRMTRLAHDTLAPLVRERYYASGKPGQRATRILEHRVQDWTPAPPNNTVLGQADLALVERGKRGMRAQTEQEQELVQASQTRQTMNKMVRIGALIFGIGALAVIVGLAILAWNSSQTATRNEALAMERKEQAERQARIALSRQLAAQSTVYLQQQRPPQLSLLLAIEAVLVSQTKDDIRPISAAEESLRAALALPSGKPLRGGHNAPVQAVAFSSDGPDGHWMATASGDRTVRLWDLHNPTAEPRILRGHEGAVLAVAFSSDGPDGHWMATASGDHTARLWDLHNPTAEPRILPVPETLVQAVAFSPDGHWVATGSGGGPVRLWDLHNLTAEPHILPVPETLVQVVAFSPDGHWVATGSGDHTVRLWDLHNLTAEPRILRGHEDTVLAVAFSPEGHWVATGSRDHTVRLWDLHNLTAEPHILPEPEGAVLAVAFSPEGHWVATGSGGGPVRLWDLHNPTAEPRVLRGHEALVRAVAFSPEGHWVATGSGDRTVRLWDLHNPTAEPRILRGPEGTVLAVTFSPEGHWVATGSGDRTVRLWDLHNPTAEPRILRGHEGTVLAVAFSPEGHWVATGSGDHTARLWDLHNPTAEPRILRGHEGAVLAVAFSPEGHWVATGSGDRTVRLWDLHNPTAEPRILRGHEGAVLAVAFSPEGHWVATGSGGGPVRLWDLHNPTAEPRILRGHRAPVQAVAFSPKGHWVATGSMDRSVRLWMLEVHELTQLACQILNRNLSQDEWQQQLGNTPYHKTCADLPAHPSVELNKGT